MCVVCPSVYPVTAGVLCFGLCAFVTATIGQEFYRGARVRQQHTGLDFFTSLIGLVARGKRRYGGYIVHIGIVLMFIGFAGDAYKRETDATLAAGKTVTLGHYTVRFDRLEHTSDPEKDMMTGVMTVMRDGALYATMRPAKWAYVHHEDEPPTSEVAINKTLAEDLYIVMNGFETKPEMANVKVVINPLVDWIWLGFLLLAAGTFIAYLPDRAYALAAARAPTPRDAGKAGAAALVLLLALGGIARAQEPTCSRCRPPTTAPTCTWRAMTTIAPSSTSSSAPAATARTRSTSAAARMRARRAPSCTMVQQLISQGMTDDQIMAWQLNKYGQQVLRVPLDTGFNRLAWLFPYAITLGGVGGRGGLAPRGGRKHQDGAAPGSAAEPKTEPLSEPVSEDDKALNERLDDELDELD